MRNNPPQCLRSKLKLMVLLKDLKTLHSSVKRVLLDQRGEELKYRGDVVDVDVVEQASEWVRACLHFEKNKKKKTWHHNIRRLPDKRQMSVRRSVLALGTRRKARLVLWHSSTERTPAAGLLARSCWGNWCCVGKLAPHLLPTSGSHKTDVQIRQTNSSRRCSPQKSDLFFHRFRLLSTSLTLIHFVQSLLNVTLEMSLIVIEMLIFFIFTRVLFCMFSFVFLLFDEWPLWIPLVEICIIKATMSCTEKKNGN